jgi:hypothetical protein
LSSGIANMSKGVSENWIAATFSTANSPSDISQLSSPVVKRRLTPNLLVQGETENCWTADC